MRDVGLDTPMPLNGLLASVRVLHNADLGRVSADAMYAADIVLAATPKIRLGVAWRGVEPALLAYGIAACREIDARRAGEQPIAAHVGRQWRRPTAQDLKSAVFAAGHIVAALRARHDTAKPSRSRGAGHVPGVLVRYAAPSWMGVGHGDLFARHRAALLCGPNRDWYGALGWAITTQTATHMALEEAQHGRWYEGQTELMLPSTTLPPHLPPHDLASRVVRWQLDTAKDWGESLVEKGYVARKDRRNAKAKR